MANIFVSYSRQSEAIVRSLADDIEALGHTAWFDQELSGGQAWWDQILASVRKCDVFVFVLDPQTLDSTACKLEYGYASELGKPILPVLVSGEVSTNLLPPALSKIQFVDYREQGRDAAFRLARALAAVPIPEPLPDPLPPRPEAPVSYLGNLTEQVETTSTLSYEGQSALLVDLKRIFREPGTTDDARTLLERLRKRRDLFAAIAEEIDDLLRSPRQSSSVPPRTSVPNSPESTTKPRIGLTGSTVDIVENARATRVTKAIRLTVFKALGFHLLLGLGLFYVDDRLKRKWLYAALPLYAIINLIFYIDVVTFYVALVLYALSFFDVGVTCSRRLRADHIA